MTNIRKAHRAAEARFACLTFNQGYDEEDAAYLVAKNARNLPFSRIVGGTGITCNVRDFMRESVNAAISESMAENDENRHQADRRVMARIFDIEYTEEPTADELQATLDEIGLLMHRARAYGATWEDKEDVFDALHDFCERGEIRAQGYEAQDFEDANPLVMLEEDEMEEERITEGMEQLMLAQGGD